MLNEIFKRFNQMAILCLVAISTSGIGPASALDSTPQSLLPEMKVNSSSVLPGEQPPYVFPKDFDEGKPKRQGEELPPLVFPKEFGNKSRSEHDTANLSDKVTISNREKIRVLVPKQSSSKAVASEVPDLLSDDIYNRTVYEDGSEGSIQSDTVMVTGPNVINNNKTHEEDVTSSSVGKEENNTEIDSVTSDLPTSEANETMSDYQNVSHVHDTHSVNTATNNNVKGTENFTYSANTAEAAKGYENFTNPGEVTEAFTNATSIDVNSVVKDAKKSYVISEKSKEKNLKAKSDNKTIKNETVTESKSTISIQDETAIKPESSTPIKNETTAKFEDESAAKTESNTTASDEISTKSESDTTIKDETAAKTKSSSSIIDEISATEPTVTLPVQQSTTTTLQPSLKAESTTQINISENMIDNKAEEELAALSASRQHADHSHASSGKSSAFLQPTESAAIFAGVFVGIALIGYIGLLVWRRVLEKRYGNREMLVNEDDFYDTNDLKNFEL